jgi:hypothetical protein
MASVCVDGERKRIVYVGADGQRRTIYLRCDKRTAESIARHVENILASRVSGQPLPRDTASWVSNLSPPLRAKLERHGCSNRRKRHRRRWASGLKTISADKRTSNPPACLPSSRQRATYSISSARTDALPVSRLGMPTISKSGYSRTLAPRGNPTCPAGWPVRRWVSGLAMRVRFSPTRFGTKSSSATRSRASSVPARPIQRGRLTSRSNGSNGLSASKPRMPSGGCSWHVRASSVCVCRVNRFR